MVAVIALATIDSPLDYAMKLFNSGILSSGSVGSNDVTITSTEETTYMVL